MANVIDIVIAATDKASAPIRAIQGSLGGLTNALGFFGGPAGLAVTGLTALAGGATAAVISVKNLASEAEHLSNVSQQAGVSVEAIQTVGLTFQRAGLSAEDAGQALKFLNKAIAEQNPLLRQLGVTSKDAYQAFLQLSDAFRARADGPNKVAAALTLLGRAGNTAIPVMNQGAAAFRAMGEEGHRTGEILSTGMVESLTKLDAQFDKLNGQLAGLKRTLAADLAGPISVIVKGITDLGLAFQKLAVFAISARLVLELWPDTIPGFGKGKTDIRAQIKEIIEAAKQFAALNAAAAAGAAPRGDAETPAPGTGMSLAQFKEYIALLQRMPDTGRPDLTIRGFRGNPKLKPDSLVDVPTAVLDSKTRALEGFRQAMADITDAGTVMSDSLNLAFSALESGFKGVFDSILAGGQGFADAMRNLFRGLVDAILQELARLAAAAVIKGLLGLLTGGATYGFGAGANIPMGKFGASPAPANRGGLPMGGGGNTYVINAINARDMVMELMSPGGSMRRANDLIAIGASY